jgi:uncharacterized membrane protein
MGRTADSFAIAQQFPGNSPAHLGELMLIQRHSNKQPVAGDLTAMSTARIEAFSDGVFSIAITLLVLNLDAPVSHNLSHTLLDMWTSYVAYVVTFLIIGVIWMNHQLMFHYIRRADRVLVVLNLFLLLSVSVLPWPASILAEAMHTGEGRNTAAALYGTTLFIGGVFFNAIWYYSSIGHRHLGAHITRPQAAVMRRRFSVGPLLYLAAAVIGVFNAVFSLLIYAGLLIAYMFEVGASSRGERDAIEPHLGPTANLPTTS